MSTVPFISSPEGITPEWLTGALSKHGHLKGGGVTDVTFDERMKADRQINRVVVTYSSEARGTLPPTLVFKQSSNGSRNVADVRTCAAVREVMFYETFASATPNLSVAQCYASGVEDSAGHSYLLLEDLTASHELVPDSGTRSPFGGWKCFDNVDAAVFQDLVTCVADLHAGWWGKPDIFEDVFAFSSGDLPSVVDSVTDAYIGRAVDELNEKDMTDDVRALCIRCVEGWPVLYESWRQSGGVETLIHNDFHLRNVVVSTISDGNPIVFDWENLCRGVGAYDVAHMLTCSMLNPEHRAVCEKAVLRTYVDVLNAKGVEGYSLEACERDYRLGVIGAIVHLYGPSSMRNSTVDAFRAWECDAMLDEAGV